MAKTTIGKRTCRHCLTICHAAEQINTLCARLDAIILIKKRSFFSKKKSTFGFFFYMFA